MRPASLSSQARRIAPAITRLPRLRGATCMTLGGTDKKGGSWDRLSWHHAATFQCNHRRSRLTQLLSLRPSSSSSTRTPFSTSPPTSALPLPGPVPAVLLSSLFSACTRSFLPKAYYLRSLVSSPLVSRSSSQRRCLIGPPDLLIRDMSLYKSPLFRFSLFFF